MGRADVVAFIFSAFAFLAYDAGFGQELRPASFAPRLVPAARDRHSRQHAVAVLKCLGWTAVAVMSKACACCSRIGADRAQEIGAMIVPCCTAYDMLLVCRMSWRDMVALVWPGTVVKGGKAVAVAREKWAASFIKRQVG